MSTSRLLLATLCAAVLAAPALTAPARDARGFEVISGPAIAPPGYNGTSKQEDPAKDPSKGVVPANPINPPGPEIPWPTTGPTWRVGTQTTTPPPCSRRITDGCVQAYEVRSSAAQRARAGH